MNPLKSIPMTVGLGFLLAIIISVSLDHIGPDMPMWSLVTWLHVFHEPLGAKHQVGKCLTTAFHG